MITNVIAIICVVGLAVGQILFKISAIALKESGTFFAIKPAAIFLAAICLYGITSVLWVWMLQKVELGRIYPFAALAFIFVPLGSHFFLAERFQLQYFIGIAMIIVGIIIAIKA